MLRQRIPAMALRGMVEVAAVQPDTARLARFGRWFSLERLIAEWRNLVRKLMPGFAAGLPLRPQLFIHPWRGGFPGLGIIAGNEVIARMGYRTALVVPDEGVVAGSRIGNRGKALGSWPHTVGESHQMIVVERQGDVANDPVAFHHRRGPADDAAETLPNRILQSGITGILRLERPAQLFGTGLGVRADPIGTHVGADYFRDVDFACLELRQFGPVRFSLDEGVLRVTDIAQTGWQQVSCLHLDFFKAIETHKSDFQEQGAGRPISVSLGQAAMKILGVIRQWRSDRVLGDRDGFWHPRFPVRRGNVRTMFVEFTVVAAQETAVLLFGRSEIRRLQDIGVALVQKVGDLPRQTRRQRLNRLARAFVERTHRIVDSGFPGLPLRLAHGVGHLHTARRDAFAQILRRLPRITGQQYQWHDLDGDKDQNQLAANTQAFEVVGNHYCRRPQRLCRYCITTTRGKHLSQPKTHPNNRDIDAEQLHA